MVKIFGLEMEPRMIQRLALGGVGVLALFLGSVFLLDGSFVGGPIVIGIGLFALALGWFTTRTEQKS